MLLWRAIRVLSGNKWLIPFKQTKGLIDFSIYGFNMVTWSPQIIFLFSLFQAVENRRFA